MAGEVAATSILIVDDHPANLRALEGVLEPLGHRVVKANSGHEALKHLLNEEFAVVLLDVQMPGLDGFETARLIKERERSRDIPILFLTALSWDEKRVVRGYSHGAVDYVHKPFEPEILRAKVKVFIDLHQRTEALRRREAAMAQRERAALEDGQERLRQSERALETQGRSLRSLTDNATLGLVMMDARQHCTFMNPAAEKIFGYTFAEVQALNRPLHDVVHHTRPDGSHFPMEECPIDRALPQKMQEQGEDVFVRKDGTFYPVAFTASPILDHGVPVGTVIEVRDITERRAEEVAHRAGEERFRAVVAALAEGIVLQDARGALRLANQSAEQLLGLRFDEMEGRTSYDPRWRIIREDGSPLPPEEHPPMVALRTGKPVRDHVIGSVHPDGTVAWLSLNSQPLFGADGKPEGVVTSLFDTSERRRSEAALRENERQFRTLADSIPQLAWMADSEGYIFWYNQRWYDYTGTRFEEMQGWGWRSVHDPAELPRVEARFRAAISSGEPWEDTFPLRRADGQLRWHLSRAMPVRDAAGRVVRWFGTNTDVEDQRRTQRESQFLAEVSTVLAGSLDYEETLSRAARLVVPTLADVCMVDLVERDGTLKRVAVANVVEPQSFAQKARSFPLSLVTGNPLYPPIQALREGRSVHVEHVDEAWIRRVALNAEHAAYLESVAPSSVIAVPLVARGRVFGVITVSSYAGGRRLTAADLRVTEELAHRAALSVDNARLYREAQDAIHIRDEFLTVASHELKTPLTPLTLKIDSFARTLQATSGAKEWEAYARDVEVMRRQVRRLTVLVNDLLDVSRIAAGRMRLELEQVDLVPLVREVTQRFESEAARAGCALEVWAEGPVTGRWDRLRLEQILANLLSNALKYGAGKPIHVRVEREGDRARLVVRDQGIGIAPDAQARIFGKFERAVSERNYGGLGLGLHVTRTLVEAMGGTVWVESALGQGATFTVELPLSGPA